jgi:predicted small secreted protein/Ca2+-binding EF-hand superfamily protein
MRYTLPTLLLASTALLAACNTVRGMGEDVESVANAFDPNTHYAACGTYGPIDRNGDGRISNSEWTDYRANYRYWDTNGDGRISRAEYANCWYGGGFYPAYHQGVYEPSWTAFDANHDGYLSADEYWSMQSWQNLDRNRDGVIDSSEWPW